MEAIGGQGESSSTRLTMCMIVGEVLDDGVGGGRRFMGDDFLLVEAHAIAFGFILEGR